VSAASGQAAASVTRTSKPNANGEYAGFDRNEYPGDATMADMRRTFAFTGYWLTVPPGAMFNQWQGKRDTLRAQGWGFLVLANGKLEAEIVAAAKSGTAPDALGRADAASAVAAAKSEGFPAGTIVFLDQEEGGRLTAPQAAYLLAWTEAVAASAYKPGVYASGQRTEDDPGVFITTIDDIRERIRAQHLHDVAVFDAQDTCPPAPGCTLAAKPLRESGEPNLTAWQYAQSPQRPSLTKSCAATYAADGKCYAPGFSKVFLDMDVATSADPSHGR
jgi:4-hydroxyphenylpyruvate dioxygenase-like putative hemolysin